MRATILRLLKTILFSLSDDDVDDNDNNNMITNDGSIAK